MTPKKLFAQRLDEATSRAIAKTQEHIDAALTELVASGASTETAYQRGRKDAFLEIAHRSLEFPDFDRERRVLEAEAKVASRDTRIAELEGELELAQLRLRSSLMADRDAVEDVTAKLQAAEAKVSALSNECEGLREALKAIAAIEYPAARDANHQAEVTALFARAHNIARTALQIEEPGE